MTELKRVLERLTSPYDDRSWLECDGLTRVLAYVLAGAGVPHRAMVGRVEYSGHEFEPHFWLVVEPWIIDYRLRMWLGPSAPHGVFLLEHGTPRQDRSRYGTGEHPDYHGRVCQFLATETIFELLSGRKAETATWQAIMQGKKFATRSSE